MLRVIPPSTYKGFQKHVRDQEKVVAKVRREGLALIADCDNIIAREDACGRYMEARFWLREFRARLAAVTPGDKYCHLSPAAQKRMRIRDLNR